jgi:hypothetical protein
MLPVDKLARPDNHILVSMKKMRQAIAKDARLLAGFTEEEIDRLIKGMSKRAAY